MKFRPRGGVSFRPSCWRKISSGKGGIGEWWIGVEVATEGMERKRGGGGHAAGLS